MLDQMTTEMARTNLAPIPMECDAPHLKVTGELPRELNGTLYRNGPNPQEADSAHWFTGDGMVHGVRVEGGRATAYRNRWVRTPKWLAEHDAGRALFGVDVRGDASAVGEATAVLSDAFTARILEFTVWARERTHVLVIGVERLSDLIIQTAAFVNAPRFVLRRGDRGFVGHNLGMQRTIGISIQPGGTIRLQTAGADLVGRKSK
jgi:hypothetical protein